MAKYEVICEDANGKPTFWLGNGEKGGQLMPKGSIVEVDPEVMKVSVKSLSLKPVGDAPVFEKNKAGDWVLVKKSSG